MQPHPALERACDLADAWAGEIMGAERVPELARFISAVHRDLDDGQLRLATDWFQRINVIPMLPDETVERISARVRAGAQPRTIAREIRQ